MKSHRENLLEKRHKKDYDMENPIEIGKRIPLSDNTVISSEIECDRLRLYEHGAYSCCSCLEAGRSRKHAASLATAARARPPLLIACKADRSSSEKMFANPVLSAASRAARLEQRLTKPSNIACHVSGDSHSYKDNKLGIASLV